MGPAGRRTEFVRGANYQPVIAADSAVLRSIDDHPAPSVGRAEWRVGARLSKATFATPDGWTYPVSSTCDRPVCILIHHSPALRTRAFCRRPGGRWTGAY